MLVMIGNYSSNAGDSSQDALIDALVDVFTKNGTECCKGVGANFYSSSNSLRSLTRTLFPFALASKPWFVKGSHFNSMLHCIENDAFDDKAALGFMGLDALLSNLDSSVVLLPSGFSKGADKEKVVDAMGIMVKESAVRSHVITKDAHSPETLAGQLYAIFSSGGLF